MRPRAITAAAVTTGVTPTAVPPGNEPPPEPGLLASPWFWVGSGALVLAAAAAGGVTWYLMQPKTQVVQDPDRLHIGAATELAEQTLRPQIAMLAELAAAAYGGPRRIELSVARVAKPDTPVSSAARTRELTERARSSPTVRSALEVLGGEVTDVRPRSRGGEP